MAPFSSTISPEDASCAGSPEGCGVRVTRPQAVCVGGVRSDGALAETTRPLANSSKMMDDDKVVTTLLPLRGEGRAVQWMR